MWRFVEEVVVGSCLLDMLVQEGMRLPTGWVLQKVVFLGLESLKIGICDT